MAGNNHIVNVNADRLLPSESAQRERNFVDGFLRNLASIFLVRLRAINLPPFDLHLVYIITRKYQMPTNPRDLVRCATLTSTPWRSLAGGLKHYGDVLAERQRDLCYPGRGGFAGRADRG